MQDKDKIFIIIYFDVRNIDRVDVPYYLKNVSESLRFDDSILKVFIPIDGETRVECINPVLLNEEKYKEVEKVFNDAKEKLTEFLNNKE